MWFALCAMYYPKLSKDEFIAKYRAARDLIENPAVNCRIVVPVVHKSKKVVSRESTVSLEWGTAEEKSDEIRELCLKMDEFQEALSKNTRPLLHSTSSNGIQRETVKNYHPDFNLTLQFLRSYLKKKTANMMKESDIKDKLEVFGQMKLDNMIKLMENDLNELEAEQRGLLDSLTDTVQNEVKLLDDADTMDTNRCQVDKDLRQATQEEDLYLDYLEYKKQFVYMHQNPKEIQSGVTQSPRKTAICNVSNQKQDDHVCQVCNDGDYTEGNLIVYCSRCGVCCHQRCYGLPYLPEGNWVCELCKYYGPEGRFMMCPLCPRRGGCMRKIDVLTSSECWRKLSPVYYNFMREGRPDSKHQSEQLYRNGEALIADDILIDSKNYKDYLYYDYFDSENTENQRDLIISMNSPKPYRSWVHIMCLNSMPEAERIITSGVAQFKNNSSGRKTDEKDAEPSVKQSGKKPISDESSTKTPELTTTQRKSWQKVKESYSAQELKVAVIGISIQKLTCMVTRALETQKPLYTNKMSQSSQKVINFSISTVVKTNSPPRENCQRKSLSVLEMLKSSQGNQKASSASYAGSARDLHSIAMFPLQNPPQSFREISFNSKSCKKSSSSKTKLESSLAHHSINDLKEEMMASRKSKFQSQGREPMNQKDKTILPNLCFLCGVAGFLLLKCASCPVRFHPECARICRIRYEDEKFYCNRHLGNMIRKRVVADRIKDQNEIRKWTCVKKTGKDDTKFVPNLLIPEEITMTAQKLTEKIEAKSASKQISDQKEDQAYLKLEPNSDNSANKFIRQTQQQIRELHSIGQEFRIKKELEDKFEENQMEGHRDYSKIQERLNFEENSLNFLKLEANLTTGASFSTLFPRPDSQIGNQKVSNQPFVKTEAGTVQIDSALVSENREALKEKLEGGNILPALRTETMSEYTEKHEGDSKVLEILPVDQQSSESPKRYRRLKGGPNPNRPQPDNEEESQPVTLKLEDSAVIRRTLTDVEFLKEIKRAFLKKYAAQHIITIHLKNKVFDSVYYQEPTLKFNPEKIKKKDTLWHSLSKMTGDSKKDCFKRFRGLLRERIESSMKRSSSIEKVKTLQTAQGIPENFTSTADFHKDALYCLCKQPFEEGVLMLGCDICLDWFHPNCVGLGNKDQEEIENMDFICPQCQTKKPAEHMEEDGFLGKRLPIEEKSEVPIYNVSDASNEPNMKKTERSQKNSAKKSQKKSPDPIQKAFNRFYSSDSKKKKN